MGNPSQPKTMNRNLSLFLQGGGPSHGPQTTRNPTHGPLTRRYPRHACCPQPWPLYTVESVESQALCQLTLGFRFKKFQEGLNPREFPMFCLKKLKAKAKCWRFPILGQRGRGPRNSKKRALGIPVGSAGKLSATMHGT